MAQISVEQKIAVIVSGKGASGKDKDLSGATIEFSLTNPDVADIVDVVGHECKVAGKAVGQTAVVAKVTLDGVEVSGTSEALDVTPDSLSEVSVALGAVEPK